MSNFIYTEQERDEAFKAGHTAGSDYGKKVALEDLLREISIHDLSTVSQVKGAILNQIEKIEGLCLNENFNCDRWC